MRDLLSESHNLVATDTPEDADILLLNTCSIREKAQEKVFHQLGRWKKLKQKNPDVIIGVGGCVASQEGAEIGKRALNRGFSIKWDADYTRFSLEICTDGGNIAAP
jgi:tRNA-2-methylthio-N6-dimethylallyladenosine synthase